MLLFLSPGFVLARETSFALRTAAVHPQWLNQSSNMKAGVATKQTGNIMVSLLVNSFLKFSIYRDLSWKWTKCLTEETNCCNHFLSRLVFIT